MSSSLEKNNADIDYLLQLLSSTKCTATDLKSEISSDIIEDVDILIARLTKKKHDLFEREVLNAHKKEIKQLNIDKRGNGIIKTYYQTTASWKSSGHIRLASYDDVLNELAIHYGIPLDGNIHSVEIVFFKALEYKRLNQNPQKGTLQKLKDDFKRFFNDEFRHMSVTRVTSEYLNEYSHNLIAQESERHVPMSERAFKNYKSVLNLIFEYATNKALISKNPVKFMERNDTFLKNCIHRVGSINPLDNSYSSDFIDDSPILSEREIDGLVCEVRKRLTQKRYIRTDGYYVNGYAFLLSKETGMRIGELPALKWSDVHDNYIWIHAQQLRSEGTSGDYIYVPWTKDDKKHTGRGRKFPLFKNLRNLLHEIKEVQDNLGIKSEYVLCHQDGDWIKKEAYESMLRLLFKSLGINESSNHTLRKSLNSNVFIPAGFDVTDRAAMLGHSVETNLRYYSFAHKDNTDELIALLDASTPVNSTISNVISFEQIKSKNTPKSGNQVGTNF